MGEEATPTVVTHREPGQAVRLADRAMRPAARWLDAEKMARAFLKDILPERAWQHYASILDFACSPEVLEPMARHSGFVPHLSGSLPPGVRLMESSTHIGKIVLTI